MKRDPVLGVLALLLTLAIVALPLASHSPNRLAAGVSVRLWDMPFAMRLAVGAGVAGIALASEAALRRRRAWIVTASAGLLLGGLVWGLGQDAAAFASVAPTPAARASAASGSWIVAACALLAVAQAGARRRAGALAGLCASALLPAALLIALGFAEHTALAREFMASREAFLAACVRHLAIVGATMAAAVPLGLALGVLAWGGGRAARSTILPALGLLQTIPSLALFGLLLPIVGIGLLPAVIALTLYALLPVARAVAAGLAGVPSATRDAARGLGLSAWQSFRDVEAPLAWRVALSGVRVAAVQAVGLAVLASLIGAGGLGTIIFQGLFANALDTVTLGVVPVVLLAAAIDGGFAMARA